ncbi:MAG: enoyl-CoA hydratase [Burkholderiaceae bacterium]|nr:enoyl-CoA hydratase [Burkholderiaceae bacterium]
MDISTSNANGIFTIAFNRPDKKNAISATMYQTMADALKRADADADVRTILICGTPEIFTAGNDLEDFFKNPPSGMDSPVFRFMAALSSVNKPVVAAVIGAAIGIGTTLLLHCDLVYASDNAKFSLPFSQLGACPEFASSLLLPQIAGYQRAAEKLLLGEIFLAEEAYEMGLVNKVLPAAEVQAYAWAQAAKLAALPAASIRASKRLMKGRHTQALQAAIAEEGRQLCEMLLAPEAKEALFAFAQKRKPDFSRFS